MKTEEQEHQMKTFHAELGGAIAAWQLVETALSQVFLAAVWSAVPPALMASYHAVQTFNGKLALTDAAVRYVLQNNEKELNEWGNLWGRLKEKYERRNHFAHYSVWHDFSRPVKNEQIVLRAQYFDSRIPRGKKQPVQYGLNEMSAIVARFFALAKETREFADVVGPISRKQRIEFSSQQPQPNVSDIPSDQTPSKHPSPPPPFRP